MSADLAWAAGLFEGEGSACLTAARKTRARRYLLLQVMMTDEDVLRRFHAVVGVGNVTGPYQYVAAHSPKWKWQASGEAARLLASDPHFFDHLGERRRARITEVLAHVDSQPSSYRELPTHCRHGHEYTEENTYTWRRIRTCRTCRREKRKGATASAPGTG